MAAHKESPADTTPEPAVSAVEAEATGEEMASVEFEGHTFTVPRDGLSWPTGAIRAFRNDDVENGLPLLLGAQWVKARGDEWEYRKTLALVKVIGKEMGFSSGN